MLPGDRLVCALISEQQLGNNFVSWPLHITIVPWFRSKIVSEDLIRQLEISLKNIHPFIAKSGNVAEFSHGRKVNLIDNPVQLINVERLTREAIKSDPAWLVDESTKTRRPYKPHVTVQGKQALKTGESFNLDRLYIIEQKGTKKEVVGIAELG